MAEPPVDTADLAEAESHARNLARIPGSIGEPFALLMREYDRRGAVEQAAAAFVVAGLCGSDQRAELETLIKAVRTNGEFRG